MRNICGSATARGSFVIRPTIPGMQFPLGFFFYGVELAVVPGIPKFTNSRQDGFRYKAGEIPMQTEVHGQQAKPSQRYVIAWQIELLEAVSHFKVDQGRSEERRVGKE